MKTLLFILSCGIATAQVPAFPGAQGGGASSVGGRGGTVMNVINLNDSGAGSLRACVEASGARTCVFRVAGDIYVQTRMDVTHPYITIAGQTAPGGGITLTNSPTFTDNLLLRVSTHDVIIRYLRGRNISPWSGASISVFGTGPSSPGNVYNVMYDHDSVSSSVWINDGAYLGCCSTTAYMYNATWQWEILAEPSGPSQQVNMEIAADNTGTADLMTDIDVHHSFFTGANHRNPVHESRTGRLVNNLIYNTRYYDLKAAPIKDIIGNYIKHGPLNDHAPSSYPVPIQSYLSPGVNSSTAPISLYIVGNAADANSFNPAANQWTGTLTGMAADPDNSDTVTSPISTTYQRLSPLPLQTYPITTDVATSLANPSGTFLGTVGASQRIDCTGTWVAARDSFDARLVSEFTSNTGHSGDLTAPPSTLPTISPGTACTETLNDGIPDIWKIARGLSTSDPTLNSTTDPVTGYTYLEDYMSGITTVAPPSTVVVAINTTNTQAVIHINTGQAGNCTYRISTSATLSPVVHDVDTTLFSGSNSDARSGSIVIGSDHWFVAGTRTSAKGLDGKFYARALAALTPYHGGVTCGTDPEVPFSFSTLNILTGNTFADPPAFDVLGLGNFALPTFDWVNPVVDHATGQTVYPITGPAQATFGKYVLTTSLGTTDNPATVDGAKLQYTNWTCPTLITCTYSTVGQDVLMIRLAGTLGTRGEAGNYNWSNVLALETGFHQMNVDALQFALSGNGGGSPVQIQVALTWNGVSAGTEWIPLTLDPTTSTKTYPAALSALLAAWQGPNFPLVPGMAFTQAEMRMQVDTNGTAVTANQGDFSVFQTDPRLLVAGSKITINSVEYTIASVDSSVHLTLTGSAGVQTNVTAHIFNFGFLVRKASSSAGTINLTNATVTMALSQSFSNGGSGFQVLCSPQTKTDSGGSVGRFCVFSGTEPGIYWITNDLKSRFIGRSFLPASSGLGGGDDYSAAFVSGQSIFDSTDGNSWYGSTALTSNGHPTLVKITYNPAGGNCTTGDGRVVPGDYQAFPLQADWSNSLDNCHFTFTEITKPSEGNDIYTQLVPNLKNGKFGLPGFSFIQGDKAVFSANPGGTNIEAWYVLVSLTTKRVTGQFSTYMNASTSCPRFCGAHAPVPSNQTDTWYAIINHDVGEQGVTGGTTSGDGPNHLISSTTLGTTPAACSGFTVDSSVAWLVPYANGCDNITFTSSDNIPCDPDPSTWETANAPACTIPGHTSWTQWEGGTVKVGDFFTDPNIGFEFLVLAHYISGSTWVVLRNVAIPHGPLVTQSVGTGYIRAHTNPWIATFICSNQGNSFVNTSEVDGSGIKWDQRFMGFNHTVLRHDGTATVDDAADVFGDPAELSVRTGQFPGVLGHPETYRLLLNALFDGQGGVSNHNQMVQSHPGWRTGDTFITDFSPYAPGSGGVFFLGTTTVTNVTGQLYRIAAANAIVPMNKRLRPQVTWSGMWNLQDVSGGTIDGTSGHSYQYCTLDYATATCGQSPEAMGDVFINMPMATNDQRLGQTFDYNRLQSFPLAMEATAAMQYYFDPALLSFSGMNVNTGRTYRRLTTALGRPNSQDTYSNIKPLEGGNLALLTGTAINMQRNVDILAVPLLPKPSAVVGNNFLSIPVVAGAANYARVQFGYAEFGLSCTTRPEACVTSTDTSVPFKWVGEMSGPTNVQTCSGGCTISIPVLPEHVVYYRIQTSPDATTWTNGPLQVAAAPAPVVASNNGVILDGLTRVGGAVKR